MGDSTVVVGDERAIKVHVHVKDPGIPLSYGIKTGILLDVVVENMQEQMEAIVGGLAPTITPPAELGVADIEPGQIGVVAVTAGDGLARIFQSLGAARIVDGGQSNNPSTEEIFQGVQSLSTDKVIILPNNKNIILAAEAARDLSAKNVVVVPTRTVPQGISAL
jgi:dihydroxyacetone kinase-like predicted kinase